MEHLDPDDVVLLALGERVDVPQTHLQDCPACRDQLARLTRTVEIARDGNDLGLQTALPLPPAIWSGIAEELGIGVPRQRSGPTRPAEAPIVPPARRGHRWRRGLLAAAAVVAIGGAVAAGVAIGRTNSGPAAAVQSQAALAPMSDAPTSAHGLATVTEGASGLTLQVTAKALPLRQGYYEVWLYDPAADQMIAVGTLGSGGDGNWTLASTIDLRSYNVVDVSAQDFDGNPAHKDSVLRGTLTQ